MLTQNEFDAIYLLLFTDLVGWGHWNKYLDSWPI